MSKPPISEAEFLRQVIALARLRGYLVFHARPARTASGWRTPTQGDVGFPDICAVKLCPDSPGRILFLELKSEGGKLTPAQRLWIASLQAAGVEAGVVRPSDWPSIEKLLE